DERTLRLPTNVVINMPGFPPLPIVPLNGAKLILNIAIDRDAIECLNRNLLDRVQVRGMVRANLNRLRVTLAHGRSSMSKRAMTPCVSAAIRTADSGMLACRASSR